MENVKVNIIGAGISGLLAAYLLEKKGFQPTIWEASDRLGGRMKTDFVDGYQMDRGFQVLLDQYPLLNKYVDLKELELQYLLPGAMIINNGKKELWGDPIRNPAVFWYSVFSSLASLSDKLKLFQLKKELEKKDLEEHFLAKKTSYQFLVDYGFSEKLIANFFQPFFSGIFLENKLHTPSAMFQFVFALFSTGNAVLPKAGIEEVPKQIALKLKATTFHFNTPINAVEHSNLIIEGVDRIASDYTVIATDPGSLLKQLPNDGIAWNRLDSFYFEVERDIFQKPIIGLIPGNHLINHLFYPQSVQTKSKGKKELLSVNVVKDHQLSDSDLLSAVNTELSSLLGLEKSELLKHYKIKKALPQIENMQYSLSAQESMINDGIYLAGDHQLNPSQNAALSSAEAVVEAILKKALN